VHQQAGARLFCAAQALWKCPLPLQLPLVALPGLSAKDRDLCHSTPTRAGSSVLM
jgi:hypothetical protein